MRVLEEDLIITGVNGVTPVLQDDLSNSYSKHDSPIDESLCEPMEGYVESAASPNFPFFSGVVVLVLLYTTWPGLPLW